MQLDYIPRINAYGDDVVRLYNFNMEEAIKFQEVLRQTILMDKKQLELTKLTFIHSRNCLLTLRISQEELGIHTDDRYNYYCDLSLEGYVKMSELIEPFCLKESKSYQWLYDDIDSPTGFLFSPVGSW